VKRHRDQRLSVREFRSGLASGIGLAGMRERLAEFGGKIRVESSSGGTTVETLILHRRMRDSLEEAAAHAAGG
jgi:signal transduction histidine kinase